MTMDAFSIFSVTSPSLPQLQQEKEERIAAANLPLTMQVPIEVALFLLQKLHKDLLSLSSCTAGRRVKHGEVYIFASRWGPPST